MSRITLDAAGRKFIEVEHFAPAQVNTFRSWICVLDAVDAGFPHLNWTQIEKPPEGYFDATLARQMAFYILCIKLGIPKKRAVIDAKMTPDAKWRAFNRVGDRMKSHCFRDHVNAMAEDAKQRIIEDIKS